MLKTITAITLNINWKADQLANTGAQLKRQIKKAQSRIHNSSRKEIKENQSNKLKKMKMQNNETIIRTTIRINKIFIDLAIIE